MGNKQHMKKTQREICTGVRGAQLERE